MISLFECACRRIEGVSSERRGLTQSPLTSTMYNQSCRDREGFPTSAQQDAHTGLTENKNIQLDAKIRLYLHIFVFQSRTFRRLEEPHQALQSSITPTELAQQACGGHL